MAFRDFDIKYAYDSGIENPLFDFYIPALEQSVSYDRIAGFFSSSSLAIAARGIGGLIQNGGKMRLLACPKLSLEDEKTIRETIDNPDKYLTEILLNEFNSLEDDLRSDHLRALGWMLANGYLTLKLAIVSDRDVGKEHSAALFHQKVGILTDRENDSISFSGSINETALGWLRNVEEFKVFKEWDSGQKNYYNADRLKFDEYWDGKRSGVYVVDLPTAVREKMIEIGSDFSKDRLCLSRYQVALNSSQNNDLLSSLFYYQKEALNTWVENDCRLMFEMATGTGKTRTAIACLSELMKKEPRIVCILACPQTTLSVQWRDEIKNLKLRFDREIFADSTNPNWKSELDRAVTQINIGTIVDTIMVYTTHITASKSDFIERLQKIRGVPICFIGDEAHGLGACKTKKALLDGYKYRIGLSATPSRWFDEYGTEILKDYFGDKSYQFTLRDALTIQNPLTYRSFLVQYYYYPVFIHLTEEEIESYIRLSDAIARLQAYLDYRDDEYQEKYELLLFKRAKIVKQAQNKLIEFEKLLCSLKEERGEISDTLVFADEELLPGTLQILQKYKILARKFTQEEGTKANVAYGGLSERKYIIKNFKERLYKVLVAIKCMDEGLDIPSATTGIIMASSTNPREYIQRLGRVLRQSPEKKYATIYDFLVVPDYKKLRVPELIQFERAIFEKEMKRVQAISEEALNNSEVKIKIDKIFGEIK